MWGKVLGGLVLLAAIIAILLYAKSCTDDISSKLGKVATKDDVDKAAAGTNGKIDQGLGSVADALKGQAEATTGLIGATKGLTEAIKDHPTKEDLQGMLDKAEGRVKRAIWGLKKQQVVIAPPAATPLPEPPLPIPPAPIIVTPPSPPDYLPFLEGMNKTLNQNHTMLGELKRSVAGLKSSHTRVLVPVPSGKHSTKMLVRVRPTN
ncbi:MAG: hypothetical protein WC526_02465 [Patescibacteria group bacterium]